MRPEVCQQDDGIFLPNFLEGRLTVEPNPQLPMKALDRFIQRWRMSKARPYVPAGARLLDVGCHEGEFLSYCGARIAPSLGLEPLLREPCRLGPHELRAGSFPNTGLQEHSFDAISMLAVLEHFPAAELRAVVSECERLLKPGGRVVITVPSPLVDRILSLLRFLRLIDGMSLEEHYGFEPRQIRPLFEPRFCLVARLRFQLGLNNLFVFEKPGEKCSA